ncbi:MAG TPA: hypothetical protein VFK02_26445 [Kofleriaceae bacterium]|nr:hypothetical protein [Kofleriaceae bacterium]
MPGFRLPVSGVEVVLRQLAGADDLLLAEASRYEPGLAHALVGALARPAGGGELVWSALTLTDLDATLLAIRRMVLGDRIESSVRCATRGGGEGEGVGGSEHEGVGEGEGEGEGQGEGVGVGASEGGSEGVGEGEGRGARTFAGCGARIDLGFLITDYLASHLPELPRGVARAGDPGWFQLEGTEVTFRLPTGADLAAIAAEPDAERALAERCIRPHELDAPLARRIEHAMEALAPNLYGELEGTCPECGQVVGIAFDPQRYVIEELRQRAAFVFEEVHLIAERYRWSEDAILTMPRARRARYAELIHEARSGG